MYQLPDLKSCKISVIGLGYVGLPIAIQINQNVICHKTKAKLSRTVVGFDINTKRIAQLRSGLDTTNEVTKDKLAENKKILYN